MQRGLSGQKERSGTGDVATGGGVARGRPNTRGLAAVWACAEGLGLGVSWLGCRISTEKPGGGWVPAWSVLQGKPRDVW